MLWIIFSSYIVMLLFKWVFILILFIKTQKNKNNILKIGTIKFYIIKKN
jgi:hypothetical protein